LIDDGSAMRPPIGSVTLRNVFSGVKPRAEAPSRYRYETASKPARKFSLLNAPPQIITETHATVNWFHVMPNCGSA
jgi:hypothetical protein